MSEGGQLRGLQRVLVREVNLADILQHLTDLVPEPWTAIIHMVPAFAHRERKPAKLKGEKRVKGTVDLLLESADGDEVAIEVKIAHRFSADQRERYERSADGDLVLVGLEADRAPISSDASDRWAFHALADVFGAWIPSSDEAASHLAREATCALRQWDATVESVFRSSDGAAKLDALEQNLLAVLVASK